jgi:hypothetical protein
MSRTVFIPECIDEKLALKILKTELLGVDYVHVGVYSPYQANAMVVRDILDKHTQADVKLLDGRVYGDNTDAWKN